MSNLDRLLKAYGDDERSKKIVEFIQKSPCSIKLDGIVGALDSFVLSGVFQQILSPQLYIAFDKEEAAYYYNTIQNILPEAKVMFLPDSFKRPKLFDELDKNNVLQRTELINYLSSYKKSPPIILTYPEALFEKVVDPKMLALQKIEINKGEVLEIDSMISLLVEYGFDRVEFVYEPGQFAIRGGIIDIFSFGNEWPYRVELFDEEVETIRTFNPTSQLSLSNIAMVSLVPNMNAKFKKEQKVSLFTILPKETLVWHKDVDSMLDKLQTCFTEVEKYSKTIKGKENEELQSLLDERVFVYPKDIIQDLANYNAILLKRGTDLINTDHRIAYNIAPQPAFNKNFTLLLDKLEDQQKKGFENYIFTENARQIDRFYNIFEDL